MLTDAFGLNCYGSPKKIVMTLEKVHRRIEKILDVEVR